MPALNPMPGYPHPYEYGTHAIIILQKYDFFNFFSFFSGIYIP